MTAPLGYGAQPRAAYATDPDRSAGRLFPEGESPTRTPFQRDRDRIIHSTAFRRLKHKTQVFVYHEGDHFRTRLTHTIEVSQIARSLARALRLDEDLAECLAGTILLNLLNQLIRGCRDGVVLSCRQMDLLR